MKLCVFNLLKEYPELVNEFQDCLDVYIKDTIDSYEFYDPFEIDYPLLVFTDTNKILISPYIDEYKDHELAKLVADRGKRTLTYQSSRTYDQLDPEVFPGIIDALSPELYQHIEDLNGN